MNITEQFGEHYSADMPSGSTPPESELREFFKEQVTQGETTPYSQYQQSADTESAELFKSIAGNDDLAPDVSDNALSAEIEQANFVAETPGADAAASQMSVQAAETDSVKIVELLENKTQEDLTPNLPPPAAEANAINAPEVFENIEDPTVNAPQVFENIADPTVAPEASPLPDAREDLKQEAQKFTEQQNAASAQMFSHGATDALTPTPAELSPITSTDEEIVAATSPALSDTVPADAELTANIQMKQAEAELAAPTTPESTITPASALAPAMSMESLPAQEQQSSFGLAQDAASPARNESNLPPSERAMSETSPEAMGAQREEATLPNETPAALQPTDAVEKNSDAPQQQQEFPTEFKLVDAEITIKGLGAGTMSGGKLVGGKGHA